MRRAREKERARLAPYLMLSPSYLFILAFMALPLGMAFLYSFQSYMIFDPFNRAFIGLGNYLSLLRDPVFWTAAGNTILWTGLSLVGQFCLGLALALLLNAGPFFGKRLYQAIVFLPWAVPGFLIGMTWKWMFNAEFGVINDLLLKSHLLGHPLGFLSTPKLALLSVVVANVWFGVPFFAITLLAGLQAIPYELYEAGTIDGASRRQLFWRLTLPLLRSTIIVSTLLRVIWIANFPDLIYI
ncbi:MAG: carbohydrate ABC transporter permease, partial [Bacteroidota bacterium]